MEIGATLSPDGNYRYKLWRIWNRNAPIAVWLMLNPSRADASVDDPTIKRCIGFSMNASFGGIEVYNLFAYRTGNPAQLVAVADPVGKQNDSFLEKIVPDRTIIAAWGHIPRGLERRERDVLRMLAKHKWTCLGLTAGLFPRHPVRLSYKTPFQDFPLVSMAVEDDRK